jgi:hypothetical protein
MIGELPNTEEQYAGKFGADTAQSMDAAKASQQRTLQSYGLKRPGIASAALDATSANQRAAAVAASSETGRLAARNEARTVAGQAIQTGAQIPQIGAQQAGIGLQSGQQQVALPATAMTTTAAGFSPSLGYMQASYPYLAQWGSTMGNAFNQNLAAYNAEQNSGGGAGALAGAGIGAIGSIGGAYAGSSSGSSAITSMFASKGGMIPKMEDGGVIKFGHGGTVGDILHTVGKVGGTIVGGIYGGPVGAMIGGKAGSALGDVIGDETGGGGDYVGQDVSGDAMPSGGDAMAFMAGGGDVTPPSNANFVPPSASPSKGAITDDVPARLNAGEFVLPKDVVSWMGEEKLQKLIQSMRQKRQEGEIAKPEMSSAAQGGAIRAQAPRFVSEGARV